MITSASPTATKKNNTNINWTVEMRDLFTPLLCQPPTTRRNTYAKWLIIKSSPLHKVVRRVNIGTDICASLLLTWHAIAPTVWDNVAKSLSWLMEDAALPFSGCCRKVLKVLYFACIPDSDVHLFDAFSCNCRFFNVWLGCNVRKGTSILICIGCNIGEVHLFMFPLRTNC